MFSFKDTFRPHAFVRQAFLWISINYSISSLKYCHSDSNQNFEKFMYQMGSDYVSFSNTSIAIHNANTDFTVSSSDTLAISVIISPASFWTSQCVVGDGVFKNVGKQRRA